MQKKGISPLITAVLLISLVISLVAVFIIWSQRNIKTTIGKAEQSQMKLSCTTDIDFDILDACYFSSDTIQVTVKNNKDKAINSGFLLRINNDIKASYPLTKVEAHGSTTFNAPLPNEEIKEIIVIPKIKSESLNPIVCLDQGLNLKVGDINPC